MSRIKILVVEDEGIVAMDIADQLSSLGYEVIGTVSSGKEAISIVQNDKPDLILMDIMIEGDFDGVATAGYINKHFYVPVVYLTANSDPKTIRRAKATSPFGYLLKPFEERELQITIEMALYRHSAEEKIKGHQTWLATVLRCIGDGIIATDPNGNIQLVNPAAEKMLKCHSTDILGKSILETVKMCDQKGLNITKNLWEQSNQANTTIDISGLSLSVSSCNKSVSVYGNVAAIAGSDKVSRGMMIAFKEANPITEKTIEKHQHQNC